MFTTQRIYVWSWRWQHAKVDSLRHPRLWELLKEYISKPFVSQNHKFFSSFSFDAIVYCSCQRQEVLLLMYFLFALVFKYFKYEVTICLWSLFKAGVRELHCSITLYLLELKYCLSWTVCWSNADMSCSTYAWIWLMIWIGVKLYWRTYSLAHFSWSGGLPTACCE